MSSLGDWRIPSAIQPKAQDYDYDLDAALAAVVAVHSIVPEDAFTAETLGTERVGNGVLIRDGLVLTVGYLITEAEKIWLTLSDGRTVEGHALAYDQPTGFGLVQPLARLELDTLPLGDSASIDIGDDVVIAGAGGTTHSLAAHVVAKQEFAGYWEYVLDEAIYTAPAHPHWGGTAVIDPQGALVGIGSLQLHAESAGGKPLPINMVVPINILKPVMDDLLNRGRRRGPVRPWLGLYATGVEDKVVVVGLADGGPAEAADVREGDIVVAVGGEPVAGLAEFYRQIWALGDAGVEVPITLARDGDTLEMTIVSTDRTLLFKGPQLH